MVRHISPLSLMPLSVRHRQWAGASLGCVLPLFPLRSLIFYYFLTCAAAAGSLPGVEYDYGISPKFVCTPIPPDADPSCFSPPSVPHGPSSNGKNNGHDGSSRRAMMSDEAKATILHLRESLVRQKETILDQRETIRELTAKLTLCEGFGSHHSSGHHDTHHDIHHNNHHDDHHGHHGNHHASSSLHHGPSAYHSSDHHYSHSSHRPDLHNRKGSSYSKYSSFSPEQTGKTLQSLKERLENLQTRNSSSSYSSSLRELLQRKISALEEQLHGYYQDLHDYGHHNDHHGDHHDDHRSNGHHVDHHDARNGNGHPDGHHDDHHGVGHRDNHHDSHHNSHDGSHRYNHHEGHRTRHHDHHYDHHYNWHHGQHHDHHGNHHSNHPDHHGDHLHGHHSNPGGTHHEYHHGISHHESHHGNLHGNSNHDSHHINDHHPQRPPLSNKETSLQGGGHKLETVLSQLHHGNSDHGNHKKLKSPSAFLLNFPMRTNYMYARMKRSVVNEIFALTICLWVKAGAGPGLGTPFSYAIPGQANELVLIEWGSNPMELLISDKAVTLPITMTDGKWHHVCVTWTTRDGVWEAYQDGVKKGSGQNLSAWHPIKPGGTFILGQEQDMMGGHFDVTQSFMGDLSDLQFWSRVLTPNEIYSQATCGGHLVGDVMSWSEESVELHGGLSETPFDPCH
ncbi:neuronal pentraxin-1 [Mastacembelus armatus]|uniref:neuronal pentraxin-1 n=1 Tax=Mastacembelus armatus TaxID=205130 RepID=UPI000E4631AD|nr:neuronal pentraxin-1-like [Mastacembelus armatus]